jgi:anti-sigma factor RsiW
MTDCEAILELLPWYVTGRLSAADAARVAAHIQSCETCRQELAEVVWASHTVSAESRDLPAVRQRVWRRVMARAGFREVPQVDIGSFLVGFRLGINARRPGAPVRATLRVMGRNMRIVGPSRKKDGETEESSA